MRLSLSANFHRLRDHLSRSRLRFVIPPLVAVIAWAVWVGVAGIASGQPGLCLFCFQGSTREE